MTTISKVTPARPVRMSGTAREVPLNYRTAERDGSGQNEPPTGLQREILHFWHIQQHFVLPENRLSVSRCVAKRDRRGEATEPVNSADRDARGWAQRLSGGVLQCSAQIDHSLVAWGSSSSSSSAASRGSGQAGRRRVDANTAARPQNHHRPPERCRGGCTVAMERRSIVDVRLDRNPTRSATASLHALARSLGRSLGRTFRLADSLTKYVRPHFIVHLTRIRPLSMTHPDGNLSGSARPLHCS